jgi:hypothetical protein
MLKRLGRHPLAQSAIGSLLAGYLKLVHRTNRFVYEPASFLEDTEDNLPVIFAMWHGQHLMVPFIKPRHWLTKVMISKSADGEINATVIRKVGMGLIRASGGRKPHQIKKRGGTRGFIEAVRALKDGYCIAMTADVPKGPARYSGAGIVQLARHSGRPIMPVAVATSRSIELDSWDKASINLPFGRGSVVCHDLIWVPSELEEDDLEAYRQQVEDSLNAATRRAYDMVGRPNG